ncbi:MAG: TonB-dependent receptor [Kofleriaceae bacterium]|nr:TonB-dependent receptor [Kofleriaceae bacterium]
MALLPALVAPAHADDPPAQGVLTKAPTLVTFVAAEYPAAEKAAGTTASVVLQVDIAADGKVTAATVTQSAGPAFDAAATAAVLQFVFTPAEVDGAPAPIRILYQYDFTLDSEVVAKTTSELTGVVRERGSGKPLANVTVALDDGTRAVTDAAGRFVFDAATPGKHGITLSSDAITGVVTEETLEAGKRLDVIYEVELTPPPGAEEEGDDLELVVTAPKLQKSTASVEVAAGVARKVPGTGGDVLRVVESMPGVARPAVGSGALVVWGASPEDTRIYVDGVRIPRLYHTGGLRSVIAADLVRAIELVPGGWGAAHGRGLGGLLDVTLAPLDDKSAGTVAVDAIDAAAAVRAPITDKLRAAVAARRSHLAWVADRVTDRDTGALFPIPAYVDAQARLSYHPDTRSRAELVAVASADDLARVVSSRDPAMTRSEEQAQSFWRTWVRYHAELADRTEVDIVAWGGRDATSRVERFGATPTELDINSNIYGMRASWRRSTARSVLELGLDTELVDARLARTGSITTPAREGDVRVFGQPPPDQLAADRWGVVTASAAPYASLDLALWNARLHVIPSLRLEPFFVSVSRRTPIAGATPSIGLFDQDTAVQPRLAVRLAVIPKLVLTASAGTYRQPPQVTDLSAVFGNPTLPASSARHLVAGAALRLTTTLSAEITGFATASDELAVRSPSSTPRLAQALEPVGSGRVLGVQALLRRELANNVFGWVSYTLSRAERTDLPDGDARLFDYDQTHVLTTLISWEPGHGVELGARFRYASGAPRTPVVDTYYDARTDRYQPLFGAHNSERLPAFVQLDARIAKRFRLHDYEGEVYLDLQNATNRANAEELVYSTDFATRSTIRGLPFLPVLGARCSW